MGIDSSYEGIKNIVARILEDTNRKSLESVLLSYDGSTGQLTGSLIMNSYFLTGIDKPYSQPSLTPIRKGTADIFSTVENRIVDEINEVNDEE